MKIFKNSQSLFLKNLKYINDTKFIFYSHLGLGDQIILSGAVNFLSKKYNKIYVVSFSKFQNSMDLLYSNNDKVNILYLPVEFDNLTQDNSKIEDFVVSFSTQQNLKILKVGYEYQIKRMRFYESFYKQIGLNYKISYDYFSLANNQQQVNKLTDYLKDLYSIDGNFKLIHNEHSSGKLNLKGINDENNIYITRESDPFNNIFFYEGLIEEASEIHCINSSFAHLVDRLSTTGKLVYHGVIGSRLRLRQNWEFVDY